MVYYHAVIRIIYDNREKKVELICNMKIY